MECAEIVKPGILRIAKRPIPPVPAEGVLVKTLYAGVCRTDLQNLDDTFDLGDGKFFKMAEHLGDRYKGLVLGHEIMGVVEKLGSAADGDKYGVKVGDKVVVYPWFGCRKCDVCLAGRNNMCENNSYGTTDLSRTPDYVGGLSSHVIVPECRYVIPIPETIPPEVACMLPCAVLTSYSALLKLREVIETAYDIRKRTEVLLVGPGGVGLWAVLIAKHLYADYGIHITCADIQQNNLTLALECGADDTILLPRGVSHDELVATLTKNEGYGPKKFDGAIDFVGHPSTLEAAFASLRKGGTLVPIGQMGGRFSFPTIRFIGTGSSIRANRTGSLLALRDLVTLVDKWQLKYPNVDVHPLTDVSTIFDNFRSGNVKGRQVIKHA